MRFLENTPATKHILAINIILFIATQLNPEFMIRTFAVWYFQTPFPEMYPSMFRPWQIITYMFMHGGFMHILFNMYSLWLFGTVLEQSIGSKKFFVFYMLCGLGAVAFHLGVESIQYASLSPKEQLALANIPTLGASGAVYGLFLGYAMLYPNSILSFIFPPISLKAKWMMLIFVGLELVIGISSTSDGIAHFAHLGGVVMGILLLLFWRKTGRLWQRDKWI